MFLICVSSPDTRTQIQWNKKKEKNIFFFFETIEPFALSAEVQRSQLLTELWFHASIGRQAAEALLKQDGDFLVRESQGKPGQYVLTGLQAETPKHLLLIDPEGTVSSN